MKSAQQELEGADELLLDAIRRLVGAFSSIGSLVREQSGLATEAIGAGPADERKAASLSRLCVIAEHVDAEVNEAVKALQFQDLVGQKLGHVRDRLQTLDEMLERISELVRADEGTGAGADSPACRIGRIREVLNEHRDAKPASPVRQELMSAGAMELF